MVSFAKISITLDGDPIALQRARHVQKGRANWTYDPQEKVKESIAKTLKSKLATLVIPSFNDYKVCEVEINFFVKKTIYKKSDKWNLIHQTCHKDLDNFIKFILDVGNELLWKDDSQIIFITSRKQYSNRPRTEIIIMPMESVFIPENISPILSLCSPQDINEFLGECEKLASSYFNEDYITQNEIVTLNKVLEFCNKNYEMISKIVKMKNKTPIRNGKTLC